MKFIYNIKHYLNRFFYFYYNIARLKTGYIIPNKLFLVFIFIIGFSSFFLRTNVLESYKDYTIILNIIIFLGILNIVYLQFNLLVRITITLIRGIPYLSIVCKNRQPSIGVIYLVKINKKYSWDIILCFYYKSLLLL